MMPALFTPAFFTVVSANYIAFAATLMQSVRRFHPDVPRFIILTSAKRDFGSLDLAADIIACDDLGIDLIANMKLWYSVIEFNAAVKPFTFHHLFNQHGCEAAIYLDPDIELYAPLEEVLAALETHSLVLTPHMIKPLQDGKHPSDLAIMKVGVYNLGFAAIRNDDDGRALVQWWSQRLYMHCRVDISANLFTDQRWMDLAPAFVERTCLLRHPGYNVAYWNLIHRTVARSDDGIWYSNDRPLAFYHFSGIDPTDAASFSKHQNRFTIETLGSVAQLCDEYRARVLANGWLTYKTTPYAYDRFADGRTIESAMRHWVLDAIDDGRLPATQTLRLGSSFFDAADERRFADGVQLTRFCYQFWRDRPDLQQKFNIQSADGLGSYIAWFCDGSAAAEGVDRALVSAACIVRDGMPNPVRLATDRPAAPPWQPMATRAWDGSASDVTVWLTGEIDVPVGGAYQTIQCQSALLWERRRDLQSYFPLDSSQALEDFHLWCLTDGMREGSIDAALFSSSYQTWLTSLSSTTQLFHDVPITHALTLTRRSEHERNSLHAWQQFPLTRSARLEHAFWFVFIAPRRFGWPAFLVAPVRAYFDQPSGLSVAGYALTRGALAYHELRTDIHDSFQLDEEAGRAGFLAWLLLEGVSQMSVVVDELCPGLAAFMARPSQDYPALSRLAIFAHEQREDLQAAFSLNSRAGLTGMLEWASGELAVWLAHVGLSNLLSLADDVSAEPPAQAAHHSMVALSGDWTATSGVGEDLRSSEAALQAAGFTDFTIIDLQTGIAYGCDHRELPIGTPIQVDLNIVHRNADTAMTDWAAMRKLGLTARRTVGHWHWELERLPSWWTHAFSFYDEIWASSAFTAAAFAADGHRPVRMLNGAVTVPLAAKLPRSRFGLSDQATVFLFIFDWASYASRKNPQAVVRAFEHAFPTRTERVQLLIKTQNSVLRSELSVAFELMIQDPRIVVIDERMTRTELIGLVAASDAFVSLHRAEGYGRAPAEAMLLGVPVIMTGYSGTTDYADTGCAYIVDYTLVPVEPGDYPGVEGQRWADADISQAAGFMRVIHERPEEARMLAEQGRLRVQTKLSPTTVGAAMAALCLAAVESAVG